MFTRRENEILALIAKGLTSEAVARSLFISIDTVKTHRKNIIKKAKAGDLKFDSLLVFAINFVEKKSKNTH